jgi:peptidoglycan hydrolase CwlO-like protein
MVGLTLVTATTATVVVPPGPVAADQVSDLKAQAAQIAQDLVLEQLQIGTYQQQYGVDIAKVQRDEAEIASSEDRIQADIGRVSRDRSRLQTEAVSAYVNSGSQSDGNLSLFGGDPDKAVVRAEYEEVASGDITLTIDALQIDQNGLRSERAALEQQEAQDQATTNQEATLTNAAHQTEVELESKQSEVTGQLAVVLAQQQAAQAAAAAAAVRAAQAAASRAANATTTTTQPSASAASTAVQVIAVSTSSGDPSLPPFLQCVLQAESSGNYDAVSPGGTYMGGFQFSQATWNEAAQLAGMPQLINVPPNEATPAEQDDLAIALYDADGEQPWNDSCRNT